MDNIKSSSDNHLNFPSDVLKFIKNNSSTIVTPPTALKLMQVCKYFKYPEFPYFVVKKVGLGIGGLGYTTLTDQSYSYASWDLNEVTAKHLWITEKFSLSNIIHPKLSTFFSKIYACDINVLKLCDSVISFDEFKILTNCGSAEEMVMKDTEILNEDGSHVSFQEIFKRLPKLKKLSFPKWSTNPTKLPPFSSDQMPFLPNFQRFDAPKLSNDFEIHLFCLFALKNSHAHYYFMFDSSVSFDDIKRYEAELEKLKEIWPSKNILPLFCYENQIQAGNEVTRKKRRIMS